MPSIFLDNNALTRLWSKIKARYDSNISTAQSDIATLKTKVATLESSMASALTRIGTVETSLSGHLGASNPHNITKTTVGLGSVPNEDWKTANLTVTADTATSSVTDTAARTNSLISHFNWLRQKMNYVLGTSGLPSKAATTTLTSHTGNTTVHITSAERTKWNAAASLTVTTHSVATSAWTGSAAPFSANVTVSGMTSTARIQVGILGSSATTDAEFEAAAAANIRLYSQTTNSITLRAIGEKPTSTLDIAVFNYG